MSTWIGCGSGEDDPAGGDPPGDVEAMVNGAAAHALDYDSMLELPAAHVSAVILPALLALGEERKDGGHALLDGYLIASRFKAA